MANNFDFVFEDVHVESAYGTSKHDHEVYLMGKTKNDKGRARYSKAVISADLLKESGWKAGDRVSIMKAKGVDKVYAIRRQNEGDNKGNLTLVNVGKQLCLSGVNVCAAFEYVINGDTFDAWYDKSDKIIMRPKKKEA